MFDGLRNVYAVLEEPVLTFWNDHIRYRLPHRDSWVWLLIALGPAYFLMRLAIHFWERR
jgi:hypothetical protein